jgi:TRAP-type mannitol/chloroaromatic compound transport system substrate-binding protein
MPKIPFTVGLAGLSMLASAAISTAISTGAAAQERLRWKMQALLPARSRILVPSAVRFSKDIERMSGGKFEIKF